MKLNICVNFFVACGMILMSTGCTNLSENLYDKVAADEYGKTEKEINSIVGAAYASLRGKGFTGGSGMAFSEYVYFISALSSDEAVLPARNHGADWYDGGRYVELKRHQWGTNNTCINGAWSYAYNIISTVNQIISQVGDSSLDEQTKDKIFAELRATRAFAYYRLIDWFGNVPIIKDYKDLSLPTNSSRAEVFKFIEDELKEVIPILPETGYGKMTKNAGNCLLARLYLNSEVFTGTPRWNDCLDACLKIKGELEPDYFTNFLTENQVSKEIIFAIPYDHKMGTSGNFLHWALTHEEQCWAISPTGNFYGGGNSMVAQPGLYAQFDENDVRRGTMLIGDQIDLRTGTVIDADPQTPGLQPLCFTDEISDILDAGACEGVHWNKYEMLDGEDWERDHDLVVMRYAEVLLMEAECYVRLNQPENARPLIEQIRTRAHINTPAMIDLSLVENELKKEFIFEDHRRTDMIRFGSFFSGTWWEKETVTPDYRGIFPIPQQELDKNNNLKQNPGY